MLLISNCIYYWYEEQEHVVFYHAGVYLIGRLTSINYPTQLGIYMTAQTSTCMGHGKFNWTISDSLSGPAGNNVVRVGNARHISFVKARIIYIMDSI